MKHFRLRFGLGGFVGFVCPARLKMLPMRIGDEFCGGAAYISWNGFLSKALQEGCPPPRFLSKRIKILCSRMAGRCLRMRRQGFLL